jgi:hypothetical protein
MSNIQQYLSDNTGPADRIATTFGVMKWLVIGVILLIAAISMIAGVANDSLLLFWLGGVAGILEAVVAWVMFGWTQHTLALMAQIARNTSAQAPPGQMYAA